MMIVDSHCHVATNWWEPVESLLFQMDRFGVERAVLVGDYAEPNNEYQSRCVRRFAGRFASVVVVDPSRSDAVAVLERLAGEGASGVRLRQMARSPGEDPFAIWRAAERLGLAVSCPGRSPQYGSPEFISLIESVPALPIVIEHLGSGNAPDVESVSADIRHNVFRLARFPNVHVKIHGLGEFCSRKVPPDGDFPFARPIPPLLDLAWEAFGPARMMWGSDYPPVSAREGYGNALGLTLEQFAARSAEDRALVFGQVALRLFPIR
jgi:predicted TIM-barrel fold metal-dependent hydrolase